MGVRANADTPQDATVARRLGAEGIGLCRTEHMFFDEERIPLVRQMILASSEQERNRALERLLPLQQADFEGIFRALDGLPVTIRLLDPPLHEFLPHGVKAIERLAEHTGLTPEEVSDKVKSLAEVNPMLGHRGCRLGLTTPAIYEMQIEAIARASCRVRSEGIDVQPEIMVPLTGVEEEMSRLHTLIEKTLARVHLEENCEIETLIGSMIEIPRAALLAGRIALRCDFFSFGTNDLTQMTYGYSRDDVGRFLPHYVETGVVPFDPFSQIDPDGVGELVRIAVQRGRRAKPQLKLGVCGEHGGDPESINFFESCGLDYVSCSPYRLPIARLAAARASLAGLAADTRGRAETGGATGVSARAPVRLVGRPASTGALHDVSALAAGSVGLQQHVSHTPESGAGGHSQRDGPRRAYRPSRRASACRRERPAVEWRFARPLGERDAGRRDHTLQ